jgi:ribosomal protein S17E
LVKLSNLYLYESKIHDYKENEKFLQEILSLSSKNIIKYIPEYIFENPSYHFEQLPACPVQRTCG